MEALSNFTTLKVGGPAQKIVHAHTEDELVEFVKTADKAGEQVLILDEVEVAAVPGEAFGPSGYLRFSYALGDEDIVEGIGRVKKLLSEAV